MACSNDRRDGVTIEEQKLGISEIAQEKEGYRLQVGIPQE
jgi:hypothetical protein